MIIQNGLVYSLDNGFQEKTVKIKDDKISELTELVSPQTEMGRFENVIDASGKYVIPGLIDIHFHGCAGHDFSDGKEASLKIIEEYELKHGITSICPATMTLSEQQLNEICKTASSYYKKSRCLKGINLEGPFLSKAKKGAHNEKFLHLPDVPMLKRWNQSAEGLIKLVSIAPEIPGAMECIRKYGSEVMFSIAHTEADYQTTVEAMKAGALHVTHIYNAMPPLTHRSPGVIGAAFDMKADVELICDGVHIDPSVVRASFQLFTEEKVILISDSMMATGMSEGGYELGGQPVTVIKNRATLGDGTIAGSVTNLYDCMVNTIKMGVKPESAIRAATFNPAKSIGILNQCGSIESGKDADLLIVNKDWEIVNIIKSGRIIHFKC